MDARVQDYLDDKLQSLADLESLDSLLDSVKAQQDLLKQQLEEARRDNDHAKQNSQKHRDFVKRQAQAFQKEQQDIDRRLLIVTQSDTSDEAAERFEASMDRLRKLDMAAGYLEMLQDVDMLKSECVSQLGISDDAALVPYRRLQSLVAGLRPLQDAAEGAAPHLLDHIVGEVQNTGETIQKAFSENLRKTLEKLHWPKATGAIPMALQKEWTQNIGRLLDLQKQDLEDRERDSVRTQADDPPALFPLEVLVHDLDQRFSYHFSGNKPTNRLDKPEYFLNHVTELVASYSGFVEDNVEPILLKHFRGSDLTLTPAYIDATSALITALMPMLKSKLYSVASQLTNQPPLLSHLVQEVIHFDNNLQETYGYAPSSPSIASRGLSYFLLDTCGYFDQWLAAESQFALTRYNAIIESPDAGDLDYDAVGADATKPTKAAIRVNDLLETVTQRYRNLTDFHEKIRFVMDVQIRIFDQYFQRLKSGQEAWITMTSTVGRTMHTLTREEKSEVQGVKGLDRLCRIFGSAEFLERAMRDWSDDVFFLELWAELDHRAKHRGRISQDMSNWTEIQQKTSSALGTGEDDVDHLEGALFDETAAHYRRIRTRSEAILVDTLKDNVRQALKPYTSVATWASLSPSAAGVSTSAELDPARNLLNEYLGFLHTAVGKAPLRRIVRQVCHTIQNIMWDNVLSKSFSTAGATQLTTDMRALCAIIDRYVGAGQAQAGMRRLLEGVTLLSLPISGEIERVQPGAQEDDGSAWDDVEGDSMPAQRKNVSLFQAQRMVFLDNESARQMLEQLGLESLSESDARTVLRNRVETAS